MHLKDIVCAFEENSCMYIYSSRGVCVCVCYHINAYFKYTNNLRSSVNIGIDHLPIILKKK